MSGSMQLTPDAPIDLQLHTTDSDGSWSAAALLAHLSAAQFKLAAITDHDRPDTASKLQELARQHELPLLVATEMSAMWRGELTDLLCYGFQPDNSELHALANDIAARQRENTREVLANLRQRGFSIAAATEAEITRKPAAQQLPQLIALVDQLAPDAPLGPLIRDTGFAYMTHPPADIVAAAHADGGICILAHPGRRDGFVRYDTELLDAFRREAPIDGIEAHYPAHSAAQTEMYRTYAREHGLLISAGSDSHGPEKPPIQYPAVWCEALLARLGVEVVGEV